MEPLDGFEKFTLSRLWSAAISKSTIGCSINTLNFSEIQEALSGLETVGISTLETRALRRLMDSLNITPIEYEAGSTTNYKAKSHRRYTFKHLVQIVMSPILDYINKPDAATTATPPSVPLAIEHRRGYARSYHWTS
jgi:hypothetical protein